MTESADPANYWKVLKNRLKKEGNETVTNCNQLKLRAADGKMRITDVATAEQMFRVIQSIPSPKAEPFKMWMAKVAAERIDMAEEDNRRRRPGMYADDDVATGTPAQGRPLGSREVRSPHV